MTDRELLEAFLQQSGLGGMKRTRSKGERVVKRMHISDEDWEADVVTVWDRDGRCDISLDFMFNEAGALLHFGFLWREPESWERKS